MYMDQLEKRIGYRVRFNNIPKAWINSYVTFNMTPSWKMNGIKARGVNYWTIGPLTGDGISSRYDRTRKEYQSWLGAYLVKFEENREFTLQDHLDLAIADQRNWLRDLGDPNPYCEMSAASATSSEPFTVGGYSGTLYESSVCPSHSDVGTKSNNARSRILMAFVTALFNKQNPSLDLKWNNFIPKDIFSEYEMMHLKGYVAVLELEKNKKVVLYGNGAALVDKNGNDTKDYTLFLKEDILEAFRNVDILKL